jgi:hypothetical protein
MMDKQQYCSGCRDDFYNHREGQGPCWSLESAMVVKHWRIGWWTQMDKASNFTKVTTLSCHHAPGQYAQMEKLPKHLGGEQA